PWRLQELPDTERRIGVFEDPTFGRRYSVFHNQVCLGTLEVSPGFKYSADKPNVLTEIELDWVRLLPHDAISGFLSDVALHVRDEDDDAESHIIAIECAITRVLWETQRVETGMDGEGYGELRWQFRGSANWYFRRRSAPAFAARRSRPH